MAEPLTDEQLEHLLAQAEVALDRWAEMYVGKPYSVYDLAVELERALRTTTAEVDGLRTRLAATEAVVDHVIAFGTNERLDYHRIGFEIVSHVDDWIEAVRVDADTPKENG